MAGRPDACVSAAVRLGIARPIPGLAQRDGVITRPPTRAQQAEIESRRDALCRMNDAGNFAATAALITGGMDPCSWVNFGCHWGAKIGEDNLLSKGYECTPGAQAVVAVTSCATACFPGPIISRVLRVITAVARTTEADAQLRRGQAQERPHQD